MEEAFRLCIALKHLEYREDLYFHNGMKVSEVVLRKKIPIDQTPRGEKNPSPIKIHRQCSARF